MSSWNLAFLTLVTVKQTNVHSTCVDFRIGIFTEDGRNGQNTGSVEWTPWAVQDGGGWSAYAGDSNFYGPDGLKIGIECDTDSSNYIDGIDFRLALQTCVGNSQTACAQDPSDVQYTSWLTEMTDNEGYSGWAQVATRFMDGWRIQIETRESIGLKFTNVVVGVQIEYSTTGPLETTQAVGEDIVSSWSDWAYNANANNGAIDAVQIFVTADLVTPEPTHDPTYNPTFAELTADPTKDPTKNPTADPTDDPAADPSKNPTTDPTTNPTSYPTSDPTSTPTDDPTAYPTKDPTKDPTRDPTIDPTADPTADPSADPSRDPTIDPTADPTNDPTNGPTVDPTSAPTTSPSVDPTGDPTKDPTTDPTSDPTIDPTINPTNDPTPDPTSEPTRDPTTDPTPNPTDDPTIDPTTEPTRVPSNDPTSDPTTGPTTEPTANPSAKPTSDPTIDPTADPTVHPTRDPTIDPTADPTKDPTAEPSVDPTQDPTIDPTLDPTADPTLDPTTDPTTEATADPTSDPTVDPTASPSAAPTRSPSLSPSAAPSAAPTAAPSRSPSFSPTTSPTADPTADPTSDPTVIPSVNPTKQPTSPTSIPTHNPTFTPSFSPSNAPSFSPSMAPSSSPTAAPTPTCHDAKYKGSMSCVDGECDYLWGGESLVSNDCRFLLTMQNDGNLVMIGTPDVYDDPCTDGANPGCRRRRRLINDWYTLWSSNTSIADHSGKSVPKFSINSDGTMLIEEYIYKNVPSILPLLLWTQNTNVTGNQMVLELDWTGCLSLSSNSDNSDKTEWTFCAPLKWQSESKSETSTTSAPTAVIYEYDEWEKEEDEANVTQSGQASLSWPWFLLGAALIILVTACCCLKALITFSSPHEAKENNIWDSEQEGPQHQHKVIIASSGKYSVEMTTMKDSDQEASSDGDRETAAQIDEWFRETEGQ